MMRRLSSPVILSAALTILASGCGGGEPGENSDDIKGAGKSSTSPSESPSVDDSTNSDRPSLKLPEDVKVDLAWETPDQKDEAAALEGAGKYVRAIRRGITQQDAEDPAYKFYSAPLKQAQSYAKDLIEHFVDNAWNLTGTERFSSVSVKRTEQKGKVLVTLCNDQSDSYRKDLKTGKKIVDNEAKDYVVYGVLMADVPGEDGLWHAESITVKGEYNSCSA